MIILIIILLFFILYIINFNKNLNYGRKGAYNITDIKHIFFYYKAKMKGKTIYFICRDRVSGPILDAFYTMKRLKNNIYHLRRYKK